MTADRTYHDGLPPAVRILECGGGARLFGLDPRQRLERMMTRREACDLAGDMPAPRGGIVLLRDDCLYDGPILDWLLARPGTAVEGEQGARAIHVAATDCEAAQAWLDGGAHLPAGATRVTPAEIGAASASRLRKRAAPFCFRLRAGGEPAAEEILFGASYKGVTDLVTKYVWPRPALAATRLCARLGLTPNLVTAASALFVLLAFAAFWHGMFGAGLAAAWIMTFLDTVDGKLARTTLNSSPFGDKFDHGIDLVHPPFWYWAWAEGIQRSGATPDWLMAALWMVLGGYVAGRLMELWFIARFGIELHVWRRFDSFFRLIVARRNPNLLLLSAFWLAGRPDLGFLAVAVWTLAGLVVHLLQIAQAEIARLGGATIRSWLEEPA